MCDLFTAMADIILAILTTLTLSLPHSGEATLLFAGDAMMHQAQIDAARRSGGEYDYSDCFTAIAPIIREADYAVVNLETPLGKKGFSGYPCFNAPASYATALKDAGFNLFLTANNHTLDRRSSGLTTTITLLDSLEIPHIGTYKNHAARNKEIPKVIEVNGMRIGLLNYTYGTNGISPDGTVVVDYIDYARISNDIKATREAGAEIIIAAMHWGEEYQLLPVASQKRLAECLAKEGVEIIIGGHPHVVQPFTYIENPASGGKSLVVYSLGNLISNMKTRDTRGGALAKVTIRRNPDGKINVIDAKYELVYTIPPTRHGENFKVVPIDSVPPAWKSQAEAFRSAIKSID